MNKPTGTMQAALDEAGLTPQRVVRDTMLAALRGIPPGATCGQCARSFATSQSFARCSAFPPVTFIVDGKLTTRDPFVDLTRPGCILFTQGEES